MRSWQGALAGYEVSAYLVRGVLVDTGFPHARAELLPVLDAIRPRGVIVTHWHEDHAGNAAALAARGVPMRMHRACEALLRVPPRVRAYRRLVWGGPDRLASPLIAFDAAPLTILSLPGHTPDHQCVWDAERRTLVSGDLFLGVKVRVAHASESPRRLVASLRTAAALEPRLLLDAHRGVLRAPVPLLRAKIDWMEETIGRIDALAARGMTEREIQHQLLGREMLVGWASRGEYSKRALVRAVLRER
jgi:glyoxylase-like metal-dependent hydrolase (beta-lactamase superfamily II)